jgi:hypothetical protein
MAIIVKYTNNDDGGILETGFTSSEQAEQYIQDSFCNDEELADDILQLVIVNDGEEHVAAEYTRKEFDC